MEIDTPEIQEADALTDCWVALAREQYDHGSHLAAEDNRTPIHDSICQHIVSGDILVAREADSGDSETNDGHDESDIVGFVMFAPKTGRYEETVAVGIIENLYVAPDRRNEGIGSALLAAAETQLRTDGIETITLDVMAANDAARRFYARHGYEAHRETMAKHETDIHSRDE